jgi:hypothetical protein
MARWLIAVVGVIYLVVAVDLARKGNIPLAIAFAAYAVANAGLYFAA